jgi:tetratricopeptide (TPR) repeat protein
MANELARLSTYYDRRSARFMDYRGYMEKQAMVKDIGTAIQRGTDQQMIMTGVVGANITNRLDKVQGSIVQMHTGLQTSIKAQTLAIVASQAALAHTFNQGFDRLNNTLDMGFAGVTTQLGEMTAAFNMGFANVERKIEKMGVDICARLDALHDILNNPLLTQSRELYRRAAANYNKGFFEEALEDINAAVEKNKTDFISWFLMGKIYLFGAGEFSNVIDLKKAAEALTQGAKYISPDIDVNDEARLMAAEIWFYNGFARYNKFNDLNYNKRESEAMKIIPAALSAFERSYQYSNNMLEALYNIARCNAILGNTDMAIRHLENLIKKNREYAIKVFDDSDFESISGQVEALIIQMKNDIYREAKAEYDKINNQLVEINNLKGTLSDEQMDFLSKNLPGEFSENLPYFDIQDSYEIFKTIVPELDESLRELKKKTNEYSAFIRQFKEDIDKITRLCNKNEWLSKVESDFVEAKFKEYYIENSSMPSLRAIDVLKTTYTYDAEAFREKKMAEDPEFATRQRELERMAQETTRLTGKIFSVNREKWHTSEKIPSSPVYIDKSINLSLRYILSLSEQQFLSYVDSIYEDFVDADGQRTKVILKPEFIDKLRALRNNKELAEQLITVINSTLPKLNKARQVNYDKNVRIKQGLLATAICVPVSFIFFLLIFVFKNISIVWGSVIVLSIIAEAGFFVTIFDNGRDTGEIVARIFLYPISGAIIGLIVGFVGWLLSFFSMTFVSVLWAIVMVIVDLTAIFAPLDENF